MAPGMEMAIAVNGRMIGPVQCEIFEGLLLQPVQLLIPAPDCNVIAVCCYHVFESFSETINPCYALCKVPTRPCGADRLLAAQRYLQRVDRDTQERGRRVEEAIAATAPRRTRVMTETERLNFLKRWEGELQRRKKHG